jgi:hypothetical protein
MYTEMASGPNNVNGNGLKANKTGDLRRAFGAQKHDISTIGKS